MSDRVERIEACLREGFELTHIEVRDDSHQHVGHAGARDGRGHFAVLVVSEQFAGLTPLARHRAVYAALGEMMTSDIHALQIRALTPEEFNKVSVPS